MQGVAVDIVTGFLGSGKTSLIQHVLTHGLQNRRVAVVVNDIGEVNLDGRVLAGINVDSMVELSNGCICCSVSYQFGAAIQEIIMTTGVELILIEATGVADPVALSAEIGNLGLRVDGLITVVDGERIRHLCKETVVAWQQLQAADFLVLNKCDLLSSWARWRVETFLRRHNPRALLVPSTFGQVQTDLLFATSAQRFRQQPHAALRPAEQHLHDDGIEAFTYRSDRPLHRRRFERFLRHLPRQLYRAKGIICFDQDAWSSIFNYTCGRYNLDWFEQTDASPPQSQAVFIGKHLSRYQDRLLARLTACELPPTSSS